ncbi:unnamed protein product [Schistocephalus solidus]|uniref:Centrosomal protein of 162 kDa n=2 Tax=Schistocephalus solidus TaxID=70667 RepID=A0A183SP20_SCHSO|nr:unnamed protein product [Schistocephalus solidus]
MPLCPRLEKNAQVDASLPSILVVPTDFLASYDDTASLEPGINSYVEEAHFYESDSFESEDETYKAETPEGPQNNACTTDQAPTKDHEDYKQEESNAVTPGVYQNSQKSSVYKKQTSYLRAGKKSSTYTSLLSRKLNKSTNKPLCSSLKDETVAAPKSSGSTPRSCELNERNLGSEVFANCDSSPTQSFLRKLVEHDINGIETKARLPDSNQHSTTEKVPGMQNHPDEKPIPVRFPGNSGTDDFTRHCTSVRISQAGSSPSTSDPMARIADLEKETHLQNELIKGFQRENEKLMAENKKLKEKAASSALPETQINSAERLFRENAVLHIELNQVKEELAVIKALRNAEGPHEARKKYECEIANLKAQNAELEQECQNHKQKCADTLQELKSAQVENPPLSSQMALQGRIHELEVKIEEQKAAEQMCIQDLQQEFETLKIKYEEHIKLLETELAGRTSGSKLTKLSKSSSQPTIDGDCDQKTQVAGLQGQLSSLKSELIRRQRIIGSRQKMTTRREEADSVQVDVTKRAVPKPRPRLVSRANLRPKSSTTCSKVMTQEESQVQTSALPEEVDFSGLQSKCADLQSRNKLLTEQIVSVSCALRVNQKALKDMQVREDSRNSLIQHLKASLTKEKLKTLKNALKTCCDTGNLGQNGGEITVEKDRITLEAELPAEGVLLAEVGQSTARLRSELNITRQRADRLQMQLDTLRGLHLAAVTGKPPKKAIERLFDQLAFLEQQQELKNKHLEEYIQCRLLEAHATGECPCAGDAKVAASAAAHWRRIAEHRAGDLARLGREMDHLIALLAELSESASASAKVSPRPPPPPPPQDASTESTITAG